MIEPLIDADLNRLGAPGTTYVGCTFTDIVAPRSDVRGSTFEECRFIRCALTMLAVQGTRFMGTSFSSCDLMGVDLAAAGGGAFGLVEPMRFADTRLDYAGLRGLQMDGWVFNGCSMVESDCEQSSLVGAVLRWSDLTGARFGGADLSGADLRGAHSYRLDPRATTMVGTVLALPEALSVMEAMGLTIGELPDREDPADVLGD